MEDLWTNKVSVALDVSERRGCWHSQSMEEHSTEHVTLILMEQGAAWQTFWKKLKKEENKKLTWMFLTLAKDNGRCAAINSCWFFLNSL